MSAPFKLMCVLAHPDDESMGMGSTLAKYAAEGVETYLVTATQGERGWQGDEQDNPGPEALAAIRTKELLAAARCLGIRQVELLGYADGDLDQAAPAEAIDRIVSHLRSVRPQVVVTFGPEGIYGHPDHVAISQFTTAAAVCAADPTYVDLQALPPHRIAKLYYMIGTAPQLELFRTHMGDIRMPVDGTERWLVSWVDWAVTTWIDGDDFWRTAWAAIACHRSQAAGYGNLDPLLEQHHQILLGRLPFYRALSTVNGGRAIEHDLFEGLRPPLAG